MKSESDHGTAKEFRPFCSAKNYGDAIAKAKELAKNFYRVEVVHIHKKTIEVFRCE